MRVPHFVFEAEGLEEDEAFLESSGPTFFMIVSFPEEAALTVCCSIERLIFVLRPFFSEAIFIASAFLGAMYRLPFLVVEEEDVERVAFCFEVCIPLTFPWAIFFYLVSGTKARWGLVKVRLYFH